MNKKEIWVAPVQTSDWHPPIELCARVRVQPEDFLLIPDAQSRYGYDKPLKFERMLSVATAFVGYDAPQNGNKLFQVSLDHSLHPGDTILGFYATVLDF